MIKISKRSQFRYLSFQVKINDYVWRKLLNLPLEQKGVYSKTFETILTIKCLEVQALYAVHKGKLHRYIMTCGQCTYKHLWNCFTFMILYQSGKRTNFRLKHFTGYPVLLLLFQSAKVWHWAIPCEGYYLSI